MHANSLRRWLTIVINKFTEVKPTSLQEKSRTDIATHVSLDLSVVVYSTFVAITDGSFPNGCIVLHFLLKKFEFFVFLIAAISAYTKQPSSSLKYPKQTAIDAPANMTRNTSCVTFFLCDFLPGIIIYWRSVPRAANIKTVITWLSHYLVLKA